MSDFMNCWHDPFVWREGDCWYMIIDSSYAELRPHTASLLLYRSEDLELWEFLHPMYETDTVAHAPLPDFFRMGDRRVLIHHCNSAYWYRGGTYIHWLTGRFERERLEVECSGTLDDGMLYAVRTVEDDRKRRLLWGQILETRPREQIVSSGWSKMQSLPRVLEMDSDGRLHTFPAPELRSLRTRHMRGVAVELAPGASMPYGAVRIFENICGTSVEILAKLELCSAEQGGLVAFCAPDFREFTLITIDRTREMLVVANRTISENLSMEAGRAAPGDSQTSFTARGDHGRPRCVPRSFSSGSFCGRWSSADPQGLSLGPAERQDRNLRPGWEGAVGIAGCMGDGALSRFITGAEQSGIFSNVGLHRRAATIMYSRSAWSVLRKMPCT